MSLSRKEIQKRKERQESVRKKLAEQRTEIRKERKLVEEERNREREMWKLEYGKTPPALPGNPELAAIKQAERDRKISEKLNHNLEILRSLEQEYEREQSSRKNINDNLEAEGYMTMKDKMDALHEKALKMKRVADDLEEAANMCAANKNCDIK
jgi:hypothetical protein